MCQKCDEGYYKESSAGCQKCSNESIAIRLVVMSSIILFIWFLLYLLRHKIKKYKNAWRDLLRVIKIQMDFWQVSSSMPSVLTVPFPAIFSSFVGSMSFVNFDIATLIGLQCVDGISFYASFAMMSFLPLFAIFIGVAKYQYRKMQHQSKKNKKIGETDGRSEREHQKELMEGLRIAFNIADKDNSGFIDVHEFAELVRNLGHKKFQDKHAQKLFKKKTDGDPFLDLKEFKTLVLDPHNKVHIDQEVIAWSSARRDLFHTFADVSQLLLLVHTPVARSFFSYFDCTNVGGREYMKADMSLRCKTCCCCCPSEISPFFFFFCFWFFFLSSRWVVGGGNSCGGWGGERRGKRAVSRRVARLVAAIRMRFWTIACSNRRGVPGWGVMKDDE